MTSSEMGGFNPRAMEECLRRIPWAKLSMRGALVFGVLYAIGQVAGVMPEPFDAKGYWMTDPTNPYVRSTVWQTYGYPYSPAFIQAIYPLHLLPWQVFSIVWTCLLVGALVWTAREWSLPLLIVLPVIADIALGNIQLFLAAAIVAGFRHPASWSFVLVTKSTLGVGLLWFVVRREWRSFFTALATTAIVVGLSFVLAPDLWFQWRGVLEKNIGVPPLLWVLPGPLWLRLVLAAAVVSWGAWTGRRWAVPVGVAIALPVAYATLFVIAIVGALGVYVRRGEEGYRDVPAKASTASVDGQARPTPTTGGLVGRWRLRRRDLPLIDEHRP